MDIKLASVIEKATTEYGFDHEDLYYATSSLSPLLVEFGLSIDEMNTISDYLKAEYDEDGVWDNYAEIIDGLMG